MKNIYITWHYTTHGVAYLKHVLSHFYSEGRIAQPIDVKNLDQIQLNSIFDDLKDEEGFVFDKIFYLKTNQDAFDKISSRRFSYKKSMLDDEEVVKLGLREIFNEIIDDDELCYNIDKEYAYVKNNYPKKLASYKKVVWRNIQHYGIEEQKKWLTRDSNFKNAYENTFEMIDLDVNDLRDEEEIVNKVKKWFDSIITKYKDAHFIINVSLGSNETLVAWHVLSQAKQLPKNTRFIKTYDDKSSIKDKRFKPFAIKEIPVNLTSTIENSLQVYPKAISSKRKLVEKKMKTFIASGFSILLLGERGIGKSHIASNDNEELKKKGKLVEANCASFDDDSKAEAELFGYKKGSFTGASTDKKGLIEEANDGVLFLDEVHHLSKFVQAKLMKALQTDVKNRMSIRKLGAVNETKVKCRIIFATNKTIAELKSLLLPDFYDRIVQHVVEIPSLRETVKDRMDDWQRVWENLKFPKSPKVPDDLELNKWLKTLDLYGNYRDLQKIAMYYNIYDNGFDNETLEMIPQKSAFQYAKVEFNKYHGYSSSDENCKFNFNTDQTTKELIGDYKNELQKWAIHKYGTRKEAVKHFKKLGDTVTEATFTNWKKN